MKPIVSLWLLIILVVVALPVRAEHENDPKTNNLDPRGHIVEPASLLTGVSSTNIHTDIAFWGNHAFQGGWLGFNIRDISDSSLAQPPR